MKLLDHFSKMNSFYGVSINKRKHILMFDGHYHTYHLQFVRWLESDNDVESEYLDAQYKIAVPFRPKNNP